MAHTTSSLSFYSTRRILATNVRMLRSLRSDDRLLVTWGLLIFVIEEAYFSGNIRGGTASLLKFISVMLIFDRKRGNLKLARVVDEQGPYDTYDRLQPTGEFRMDSL